MTRVIIFSTPRTGTTWLRRRVSAKLGIRDLVEPLNPDQKSSFDEFRATFLESKDGLIATFHDYQLRATKKRVEDFGELLIQDECRVLVQDRLDIVAQYQSDLLARTNGNWTAGEYKIKEVRVNTAHLFERIHVYSLFYREVFENLATCKVPFRRISYESLVNGEGWATLSAFFGADVTSKADNETVKQTVGEENVLNPWASVTYDEIAEMIQYKTSILYSSNGSN